MYAKVFTSMWDGSLYGQLEASAVLMACVTLCNADGILDMTQEAIAGRTGWPIEFIRKGVAQLESDDPRSRTPDEDGRRLVRLDAHRDWGWLIVNYQKYRSLKDLDTVKSQTKERVQRFRDRKRSVTLSNADETNANARKRQAEAEAEEGKSDVTVPGLDLDAWSRWLEYRKKTGKPIKPPSIAAAQRKLAKFGPGQAAAVENSIAEGYTGVFAPKGNGRTAGKVSEWE